MKNKTSKDAGKKKASENDTNDNSKTQNTVETDSDNKTVGKNSTKKEGKGQKKGGKRLLPSDNSK